MSRSRLRVHAVGLALDPNRAVDREDLCASVGHLLDRAVTADEAIIDLVALPEHTGLLAMLVGERGAQARALVGAGAPTVAILEALAAGYPDELASAAARFPTVTSTMALVHLAVADTLLRVVVDGFGSLAADRSLWLSVAAALPDFTRDHDPATDARFTATSAQVRNRNLLLAPDGSLAAVHDKAYLVDVERDPGGLGLTAADLADVHVTRLPFGRVASVISKDAWMPDVNDRLDQLGAQVLLQPEAFDRWGCVDRADAAEDDADAPEDAGCADLWPPDKLQRGGWWMVRRHRSPVVNVTPMLLGEIGELRFDGQALIATADPGSPPWRGLLGQPPDVGWAAVGPWRVVDEPIHQLADPGRRASSERAALAGDGRPVTVEDDHVATTEVVLPALPTPAALPPPGAGPSAPIGGAVVGEGCSPPGLQLVPDLAADDGGARLVWIAASSAGQHIVSARFDGERFSGAAALGGPAVPDVTARRWRPRVVAGASGAVCLYLGFTTGGWDLFTAPIDDGPAVEPVRVDDADRVPGTRRERGHDAPCLVRDGADLVAVWSDLRWPWVLPQVRVARSRDGGRSWSPSRRVDGGTTIGQSDPLAARSPHETRGQTAPAAVAVPGGLVVAWQELAASGLPSIRAVRLRDDRPRAAPVRLDDGTAASYRPTLAAAGSRVWAAYERVPSAAGAGQVVLCRSDDGGASFSSAAPVDETCPPSATQRCAVIVPPAGPAPGSAPRSASAAGPTIVLEDDRAGEPRVLGIVVQDDGRPPDDRVVRIDDAPDGAAARAPTAVRCGARVVVVWQDTRGGGEHLRRALLTTG